MTAKANPNSTDPWVYYANSQPHEKGGETQIVIQVFGQLMQFPLEVLGFGLGMFVKAMQSMQTVTSQGLNTMSKEVAQTFIDRPQGDRHSGDLGTGGTIEDKAETTHQPIQKEHVQMPDMDLSGEQLKLVRYKILFVKRDYEYVFPEVEELVPDNTDANGYTAWKIAEFIQHLHKGETPVPPPWGDYPKDYIKTANGKKYLLGFPEGDKKYLRVYFDVLQRYDREPLKYEQDQLAVLREIRNELAQGRAAISGPDV